MLQLYRALKTLIISSLLAVGCGYVGAKDVHDRWTYTDPTPVSCKSLKAPTPGAWLALSDCIAIIPMAVSEGIKLKSDRSDRSASPSTLYVPLQTADPEDVPWLVLETSNKQVLAGATAATEYANRAKSEYMTKEEKIHWAKNAVAELKPVALPTFTARVDGAIPHKIAELFRGVSPDAVLIREFDGGKPGILWGLVALAFSLLWGLTALGALASLVRPKAAATPDAESSAQP